MTFSSKYSCVILVSQKLWQNFDERVQWKLSVFSGYITPFVAQAVELYLLSGYGQLWLSPHLFLRIYTLLLCSQFSCHLMGDQRGWRCLWGWGERVLWSSGVHITLKPHPPTLTPSHRHQGLFPSPQTHSLEFLFPCPEQALTFISTWFQLKQKGASGNTPFFSLQPRSPLAWP